MQTSLLACNVSPAVISVRGPSHVWPTIIGLLGKHTSQCIFSSYLIIYQFYFNYFCIFRISILVISIGCAIGTFVLAGYLFHHRKVKVFKVASPIFLLITLIGCAIMYLEVSEKLKLFENISYSWVRVVYRWN